MRVNFAQYGTFKGFWIEYLGCCTLVTNGFLSLHNHQRVCLVLPLSLRLSLFFFFFFPGSRWPLLHQEEGDVIAMVTPTMHCTQQTFRRRGLRGGRVWPSTLQVGFGETNFVSARKEKVENKHKKTKQTNRTEQSRTGKEKKPRAEVSEVPAPLASAQLTKSLSGSGRVSHFFWAENILELMATAQNQSELFIGLLLPPRGQWQMLATGVSVEKDDFSNISYI